MKRIISLMAITAFVAVQFVDIVILDDGHAVASEIHAQLDLDNDSLPDGPDNCEIHCGCHMLHHMGPTGSGADCALSLNPDQMLAAGQTDIKDFNTGPPTPPPLV